MASKMVNAAADASLYVESSLRQHGDELARRLAERWRPLLPPGVAMPDPATLIRLLADDLAACREDLSRAGARGVSACFANFFEIGCKISRLSSVYMSLKTQRATARPPQPGLPSGPARGSRAAGPRRRGTRKEPRRDRQLRQSLEGDRRPLPAPNDAASLPPNPR